MRWHVSASDSAEQDIQASHHQPHSIITNLHKYNSSNYEDAIDSVQWASAEQRASRESLRPQRAGVMQPLHTLAFAAARVLLHAFARPRTSAAALAGGRFRSRRPAARQLGLAGFERGRPAMTNRRLAGRWSNNAGGGKGGGRPGAMGIADADGSVRGGARRFYAVHRGRDGFKGVLNDWPSCKNVVHGVPNSVYKAFSTRAEALAFVERGFRAMQDSVVQEYRAREARGGDDAEGRVGKRRKPRAVGGSKAEVVDVDEIESVSVTTGPAGGAPRGESAGNQLIVYTDGACVANGKRNARAGVGVYFGSDDELSVYNVSEPLEGPTQTNQRAELTAALRALQVAKENGLVAAGDHLIVRTDSMVRATACLI
jgi:hypothetical protein